MTENFNLTPLSAQVKNKFEIRISNPPAGGRNKFKFQMKQNYDLEERTFNFAKDIREFLKILPRTSLNIDDMKQLARSSGSVGANYIEANESLSKKDFLMRAKICRKEAKETIFWLKLIETTNLEINTKRLKLLDEAMQLMKIFGSIIQRSQ